MQFEQAHQDLSLIELDGSVGEGGGQILRSALSLSAITGRPVRLFNIRKKRRKPGLMRQHLTAVKAAAAICGAKVEGAELGADKLTFAPSSVRGGEYSFAVGSAGSANLVLQTVIPALLSAGGSSRITVEGGTHNPMCPPFDFLNETFFPILKKMGVEVTASLDCPGFFPAGGGKVTVTLEPAKELSQVSLLEREEVSSITATILHSNLPIEIAERERQLLIEKLKLSDGQCSIETLDDNPGPGNVLLVRVDTENHRQVFTGFGQKGVPATRIVDDLAKEVGNYVSSSGFAGPHLADQLILPMGLAGGGAFSTSAVTEHTATNIGVVEAFLPVRFDVREELLGCTVIKAQREKSR